MGEKDLLVQWKGKVILSPLELLVLDHFKIVFISSAKHNAIDILENLGFLVVYDMNVIYINFTYFS